MEPTRKGCTANGAGTTKLSFVAPLALCKAEISIDFIDRRQSILLVPARSEEAMPVLYLLRRSGYLNLAPPVLQRTGIWHAMPEQTDGH